MSYYIWCDNVTVTLRNHEHYNSKEEVLEAIKDNEHNIQMLEQELFGLVCGNPKDLLSTKDLEGAEINPIEVAQCRFNSIMTEIKSLSEHNIDLGYIADYWDKHEEG